MIFSSLQINTIWINKTAVLDKIYIGDDKCLYKGLADGSLLRLTINDPDAYIKEIRRQEAALEANEYNQQEQIDSLANSVVNINTQIVNINNLTSDSYGYSIKDAAYNWLVSDLIVKVTREGATQKIHTAVGHRGKEIMIINASSGTVRVGSSLEETIGNSYVSNPTYFDLYSEEVLSLKSDGVNWNLI